MFTYTFTLIVVTNKCLYAYFYFDWCNKKKYLPVPCQIEKDIFKLLCYIVLCVIVSLILPVCLFVCCICRQIIHMCI